MRSTNFKFIYFDVDKYHHSSVKAAFIKIFSFELTKIFKKHKSTIEDAKDKALGNILTYRKNTDSHITVWVVLFAYLIFLSARNIRESISIITSTYSSISSSSYSFSGEATTTVLFAFSPVIMLLSMWAIKAATSVHRESFGVMLGNLLQKNSKDKITEKILVNREVSSIELEEAFKTISGCIPDDFRVALVIDNLDRVNNEYFREVWSDLEIFTDYSNSNLKIIVPFSENQVLKALDEKDCNFGREFISKRLPVVFRVPPIVSAGWRKQFDTYWDETIGSSQSVYRCADIIDIWESADRPVTPRFLKKHLNGIVAVLISNPNEDLKYEVCSAYILSVVLKRIPAIDLVSSKPDAPGEGAKTLTQRKIHQTQKTLNSVCDIEEWSNEILKIHYQIPLDHAKSELLDRPIEKAINEIDSKSILERSDVYGFNFAFEKCITEQTCFNLLRIAADIYKHKNSGSESWLNLWLSKIISAFNEHNAYKEDVDGATLLAIKDLLGFKSDLNFEALNRAIELLSDDVGQFQKIDKGTYQGQKSLVSKLYHYCDLFKLTPDSISSPSSSLFVNFLWPAREVYRNWPISDASFNDSERHDLLIECSERSSIESDEKIELLFWILERSKLDDNAWKKKCQSMDPLIEESERIELCVFHSDWEEGSKFLADISFELNQSNGDDPEIDAEYTALLFSGMLSSGVINGNYSKHHPNNKGQRIQASAWGDLNQYLVKNTEYSKYLSKYLAFVPYFSSITRVLADTSKNKYLHKGVKDLITTKKVHRQDLVKSVSEYDALRSIFIEDQNQLINWMQEWLNGESTACLVEGNNIDTLSVQFVTDVLSDGSTNFKGVIDEIISNIQEDGWRGYLANESTNIRLYIDALEQSNEHIDDSVGSTLYNAISDFFVEEDESTLEELNNPIWITKLVSSIAEMDRDRLLSRLTERILERSFDKFRKYAIIRNLPSLIKIQPPTSESSQQLIIGLFDEANSEVLTWLIKQNWEFQNWEKSLLEKLKHYLESSEIVPQDSQIWDDINRALHSEA